MSLQAKISRSPFLAKLLYAMSLTQQYQCRKGIMTFLAVLPRSGTVGRNIVSSLLFFAVSLRVLRTRVSCESLLRSLADKRLFVTGQ